MACRSGRTGVDDTPRSWISFPDVPALISVLRNVSASRPIGYRVEGTVGVEIGRLGAPTFGPMTLFSGELRTPTVGVRSEAGMSYQRFRAADAMGTGAGGGGGWAPCKPWGAADASASRPIGTLNTIAT